MRVSLKRLQIFPSVIIFLIAGIAILTMYSINDGKFFPLSAKQSARFCFGFAVMVLASSIDINKCKKYAYHIYAVSLVLLLLVELVGKTVMGAQRWLDLYFFSIQPSEIMRITLIIALAKYFSTISTKEVNSTKFLIFPTLLTLLPVLLVLKQPDLGTAMLLIFVYCSILLVAGIKIWKLALLPALGGVFAPFLWSVMHDYQKARILMFLCPETDPNGAGYHIIQSKIALGSGGLFGKGFMQGTQGHLNFLPEKHNDFIFAAFGEEFGFIGCAILLVLYFSLLLYNYNVALQRQSRFSKYLVFGLNAMLFFYVFINISMVCGLLPVVGIPLPFFSYGGTALVVLMFSQGLINSSSSPG